MVIDAAKGIEPQTKKLFQICKMRGIPIFTFMNKMDRDSRDPMELIDELEDVLGIEAYPMNWPIGMGKELKGLYDRYNNQVTLFKSGAGANADMEHLPLDENGDLADDVDLKQDSWYQDTRDNMELIADAGNTFDQQKIKVGDQTPVFFGSALANFGVKTFLEIYLKYAPKPAEHKTENDGAVEPTDPNFSGFVFKIQANMNPNHRDRIAFVRICSGQFTHGMDVTLERTEKKMRLSNVTQFMADTRENVDTAVAGDIIGLYDTGNYQIGDSIYTGKKSCEV